MIEGTKQIPNIFQADTFVKAGATVKGFEIFSGKVCVIFEDNDLFKDLMKKWRLREKILK